MDGQTASSGEPPASFHVVGKSLLRIAMEHFVVLLTVEP